MQVRHRHVVIFERARQKSIRERGLRRRQPTADAYRRRLLRPALSREPSRKTLGGIEVFRRKAAADRIEKMLSRYCDQPARQAVYAEIADEARDRAAQIVDMAMQKLGQQKKSVELAVPNVELAWKLDDVFMERASAYTRLMYENKQIRQVPDLNRHITKQFM